MSRFEVFMVVAVTVIFGRGYMTVLMTISDTLQRIARALEREAEEEK